MERALVVADCLPATLTLPPAAPRLGLVALHPAGGPSRDFPLLRHLADALPPHGIAVLRYDRRPGEDVPLPVQRSDAEAALVALHSATDPALPIVIWGFSQGAWVTLLVAHSIHLAGAIVVGLSGVSPALQMRYTSARQIREAGFDEHAVADMMRVRLACEDVLRGRGDAAAANAALTAAAREPWFVHAWLPEAGTIRPPTAAEGFDIDFEPAPLLRTLPCALLAVVGDDDRWVPLEKTVGIIRAAPNVEVLHVPGGDHAPTVDGDGVGRPLAGYERGLVEWLSRRVQPTPAR